MGLQLRSGAGLLLTVYVAATLAITERSDALIGYSEDVSSTARAICQDKEDGCAAWQRDGECLTNPYYMRFKCAQSCQVPACVGYKQQASSWKGHATEYHTKQYTTRSVLSEDQSFIAEQSSAYWQGPQSQSSPYPTNKPHTKTWNRHVPGAFQDTRSAAAVS